MLSVLDLDPTGIGVRFVTRFAPNDLLPELACRLATWLRFSIPAASNVC